jgi:hypothetical protein
MPAGMVSAGAGRHYVRIVDTGGGTNEVVLLTAITATTVSFTPQFNHVAGAWTLTDASAGLQEAFYANSPADLLIPAGSWSIYGPVITFGFNGNTLRLCGVGQIASRLKRSSTFPSGDLFTYDASISPGELILSQFSVLNADGFDNPSGRGLFIKISQPNEVSFG